MSIKKNIRKAIFICAWLLVGAGAIVLLVAAVSSRNHQTCKGYDIDINGKDKRHWFLDKIDIVNVLTQNKTIGIKGKKIASFDLHRLESRLEKEVWILDAELYFDNNGLLKIKIKEREPIARVFNTSGESFYFDSTGHRLPLSNKMEAHLPIFKNFPGDGRKIKSTSDKKLVKQIKELSIYLARDTFWMNKLAQIDITPAREFELVPVAGNHIVEFGDATDKVKKFKRLLIFYQQVLPKTGPERYKRIRLQYANQVIGVRDEIQKTL